MHVPADLVNELVDRFGVVLARLEAYTPYQNRLTGNTRRRPERERGVATVLPKENLPAGSGGLRQTTTAGGEGKGQGLESKNAITTK